MRIAILGSVALPVPPLAQGGTEWIAYYQAAGLSKLGHKVLLFAASGSKRGDYELIEAGKGDTVAGSQMSNVKGQMSNIESSRSLRKENVYLGEVIEQLIKRKDDYDVILNNMRGEAVFLPIAKMLNKPFANVMHLPLFPELAEAFKKYNTHVITISNAQRKGFEDLNYLATVSNCVDTEKYIPASLPEESSIPNSSDAPPDGKSSSPFPISSALESTSPVGRGRSSELESSDSSDKKTDDYMLMMGTIGRHKNQAGAIRIAKETGMKLVLAGKIRDKDYFEELKKEIDGIQIRWVGEMGFEEKLKLYQNAKVFIFPILWEEPFGLVMIEAMACGVPVVAYNNGAIPEVVVSGVNGFVVESGSEKDMVSAVNNIGIISRVDCRKYVEEHFTVEKMVRDYEKALLSIK